jgi:hypothetical protein
MAGGCPSFTCSLLHGGFSAPAAFVETGHQEAIVFEDQYVELLPARTTMQTVGTGGSGGIGGAGGDAVATAISGTVVVLANSTVDTLTIVNIGTGAVMADASGGDGGAGGAGGGGVVEPVVVEVPSGADVTLVASGGDVAPVAVGGDVVPLAPAADVTPVAVGADVAPLAPAADTASGYWGWAHHGHGDAAGHGHWDGSGWRDCL